MLLQYTKSELDHCPSSETFTGYQFEERYWNDDRAGVENIKPTTEVADVIA